MSILIIDDSAADREGFTRTLMAATDYHLATAETGDEAIGQLRQNRFNCILLDNQLPDTTGLELLETFYQEFDLTTPVVFLTGQGNQAIASEAIKRGASDYMVKDANGYYLDLLPQVVEQVMARHDQRREKEALHELYEVILDTAGEGIIGLNSEGRMIFANPAAQQILRIEQDTWVDRELAEFVCQHTEDHGAEPISLAGNVGTQKLKLETVWVKGTDGPGTPVSLTATPLKKSQNTIGTIVVLNDMRDRWRLEQQLRHISSHDYLTGLANRAYLHQALQRAISHAEREATQLCILYVDLDQLKLINDNHGHETGDTVIQETARRLEASLRGEDLLARIGGDEFMVLLESNGSALNVATVAEKLLRNLQRTVTIKGCDYELCASIGIAVYPDSGNNANDLVKAADAAMYTAKQKGGNDYRFYTPQLKTTINRRIQIERELRQALENDELELKLQYQPLLATSTGQVLALEALLRWQHPGEGYLLPRNFLPYIRNITLLNDLGHWMLGNACHHLRTLMDNGANPELKLLLNLGEEQLRFPGLVENIAKTLQSNSLRPENLDFAISYRCFTEQDEPCLGTLLQLKKLGIGLTIDDFGVRYLSTYTTNGLTVDGLKLDRRLISGLLSDPSAVPIIDASIALAKALGMRVMAEGVETQDQADFLRDHGCENIQGFHVYRPLDATETLSLVTNYTAGSIPVIGPSIQL